MVKNFDENKKKFYFLFRFYELLLEQIHSGGNGRSKAAHRIIDLRDSVFAVLNNARNYSIKNDKDTIYMMASFMKTFLGSIKFTSKGVEFDEEALEDVMFSMGLYRQIYFDADPIDMIELDAELATIMRS